MGWSASIVARMVREPLVFIFSQAAFRTVRPVVHFPELQVLAANPEAKVSAKQVTDTLDALAGLKAARYIVDAKADLKLYGLDPALWTIDVQTPTGKRTLLVGRRDDFRVTIVDLKLRRRDFGVILLILKTHRTLYFCNSIDEYAQ